MSIYVGVGGFGVTGHRPGKSVQRTDLNNERAELGRGAGG
jgi:hypothetical protein